MSNAISIAVILPHNDSLPQVIWPWNNVCNIKAGNKKRIRVQIMRSWSLKRELYFCNYTKREQSMNVIFSFMDSLIESVISEIAKKSVSYCTVVLLPNHKWQNLHLLWKWSQMNLLGKTLFENDQYLQYFIYIVRKMATDESSW